MNAARLREDLQRGGMAALRYRRWIAGVSLLGAGSMAAVTLLQMGVIGHLPDPPLPGFDSDKVNLSDAAFKYGAPDGPFALASLVANLPLAAFGGADRAREQRWLPLVATAKAAVDAAIAGWYFYQMPAKEKAWCGYCIAGALASFGVFALTLPEAGRAFQMLRDG